MVTIIYGYFGPLLALLFLLFLIKFNHLFNKKQSKLFFLAAIINLVLVIATSADFLLSKQRTDYIWIFRRLTSFINFAGGPLIPLILLIIFKQKKNSFFLYIPMIINAVLCFLSIFVNIVFFIGTNNGYGRGPLFFMPLVTTFFYFSLMIIKPDDFKRQGRKTERMFMFAIIFMTIVGSFMEIVYGFLFITYISSSICLIAFYILKNILYFMVDPLTGAYNRQVYHQELSQITHSSSCIIILLDINDFKLINDNNGHEAGDKALITFVEIFHRHLKNKAKLYRIGGDEFAILSEKAELNILHRTLKDAEIEIQKNNITFAYGIAEYSVHDDLQEILRIADKRMYENKILMKTKCV